MKYLDDISIKRTLANTRQIVFEVTERCNLNCYYCGYGSFYSDRGKRTNDDLNYQRAILFLEYMKALWQSEYSDSHNRSICISFYGGEPLLNMKLIQKIIAYIEANMKDVGRIFQYAMTTNALLLNKYADYLVEKDFQLLFSLDGNEHSSSYRVFPNGQEAFKFIIDNINQFRHRFPLFYKNNVNFNAVLHNKNSVEELYDFFRKHFDKTPSIAELSTSGIRPDKKEDFKAMFHPLADSLMKTKNYSLIEQDIQFNAPTYKTAALYLLYHSDFKYDNYNELLYGKNITQQLPTGTCLPFSKKVFITVSGKILPCERIGHQYTLGEITDYEIKLDFAKIAETYNAYYKKLEQLCSKCYGKKGCTQCMFHIPELNELSKRPVCDEFMNEKNFLLYKNNQLSFFSRHPEFYADIMKNLKHR